MTVLFNVKKWIELRTMVLEGYCTIFQHVFESLEITGIVLSHRMLKIAETNLKGDNVKRNTNFNQLRICNHSYDVI